MPDSMTGSSLTAPGTPYDLNGVTVTVANFAPSAYPAASDPDHPEWSWPTLVLAVNSSVIMTSGISWKVNRPPVYQYDGSVQVSLKKPGTSTTLVIFVPAESLDVPIWYTGQPVPTNDPLPPPVPV
jgi:hypothetical protein